MPATAVVPLGAANRSEAALTLHVNGIAGDATITFACTEGPDYSHTFQVVY